MRKLQRLFWVGFVSLFALTLVPRAALAATPAPNMSVPTGVSFAEIKITGDEFVVLQNNTGSNITDLSSYWLQDFNNVNPLAAGVSSSSQQLPQVALGSGQTLLLSSATQPTCGAAVAGKLSISLTDGGGFLELVQMGQNASGAVTQTPGDVVSWSSSTSGSIPNVPSSTKDPKAAWYRYQKTTSYPWQLADIDSSNACQLDVVTQTGTPAQPVSTSTLGQADVSPPATIVSLSDNSTAIALLPTIPAGDLGLLAPQLSELLPNPNGTGTDNTDEFVELYNPNAASFDLSGFSLQVGTTTTHSYTFPTGTAIAAKSFKAFYSNDTGLSMSNTGGQAVLLDPLGTAISQSDTYGSAKDGQSWALANGKWYWTTTVTPAAANVINQPVTINKSTTGSKKSTKASSAAVKGAKTSAGSTSGSSLSGASDVAQVTPIHPWTLALVALLALLYGAYEYRVDIKNRLHQFRANRAARRVAG